MQLYTVWNLHELHPNEFNFSGILDLSQFLQDIKDADMFAIVRPGPYICSEWEFGGLPSWLLRDKEMKVRSNYSPFLNATENYLKKITEVIKSHQFSTNGGPIIAVQIENVNIKLKAVFHIAFHFLLLFSPYSAWEALLIQGDIATRGAV